MQSTSKSYLIEPLEPESCGNSYFGNPYENEHEQFGLEFLDRNQGREDEVEQVVILGYN